MNLKDLAGNHTLSGVDRLADYYGDPETISFRLDDKTYTVRQDHMDGYRSAASDDIDVSDDLPVFTFPPVDVVASWEGGDPEFDDELLTIRVVDTNEIVLHVGTSRSDHYYPCFVCEYDPTALGLVTSTEDD